MIYNTLYFIRLKIEGLISKTRLVYNGLFVGWYIIFTVVLFFCKTRCFRVFQGFYITFLKPSFKNTLLHNSYGLKSENKFERHQPS